MKVKLIVGLVLSAPLLSTATVVVGFGNATDDITRGISVENTGPGTTNVNFKLATGDGEIVDWANLSGPSDTWTGGATGDEFAWTLSTANNWVDGNAADASTLSTYLTSGLTAAVQIDGGGNAAGVDSGTAFNALGDAEPNRVNYYGEALVMTVDSLSLSAGTTVLLNGFGLSNMSGGEYLTFAYYDLSADSIVSTTVNGNNIASLSGLGIEMGAGDKFIFAAGADTDPLLENGWRLETMSVDMIPEPASLGLIVAAGAGILFIRRRFRI